MIPGSREAQIAGCTCPVLDNSTAGIPLGDGQFGYWVNGDCPIHGLHKAPIPEPETDAA